MLVTGYWPLCGSLTIMASSKPPPSYHELLVTSFTASLEEIILRAHLLLLE